MSSADEQTLKEIEALLPAYVLGALEPEAMQLVDRYIRQQREFLARVKKFENQSSLFAHIADAVTPPTNIKRAIMMIARLDAPAEPTMDHASPYTTAIQPYAQNGNGNGHQNGTNRTNGQSAVTYAIAPYRPQQTSVTRRPANVGVPQVVRQRRITLRLWQVAAIAALLALVAVATSGILLNQELNRALAQNNNNALKYNTVLATNNQLLVEKEALRNENLALAATTQRMTEQIAQSERQFTMITQAERATPLRGVNPLGIVDNSGSQAIVYTIGNIAAIVANGLSPLPADQTYQLWLLNTNGDALPAAVFTAQPGEDKLWREFALSNSESDIAGMAISIEQLGGSVKPSTFIMRSLR